MIPSEPDLGGYKAQIRNARTACARSGLRPHHLSQAEALLAYQRDYYLHDAAGNELVVASSQWCIINFQTRKVERSSFDYQGEFCNKIAFLEGFERIRLPELTPAGRYVITERDLDRNEHTNNCRYADIVAGVLDRKEAIRRFLIHYAKETRLHDEIQLFQASTEDGRIVVGKAAGRRYRLYREGF